MNPELSRTPTTVLLIDSYKEDRENWVQRLSDSAPDYLVLEAETEASELAYVTPSVSIASSRNSHCPTCPALKCLPISFHS